MSKKIYVTICFVFSLFTGFIHSQNSIEAGKKLYELKCGRCHSAYDAKKYNLNEWTTIVKEMGPLSGLDEKSESLIMGYLASASSENSGSKLPTNPVLSGYIYTEYFSGKNRVDTFDQHYLNISLTGRLHKRITYRAEFEFEHGGGSSEPPFVEQAYIDVWLFKNMGFRIGAILTPFNRFDEFHGPLENFLITRPQMSREIGVSAWKEVGINLHGTLFVDNNFYLNYDLYAINGLGSGSRLRKSRHYRDNNDAKSLGFRFSGVLFDRWEAGISYYHGAWDDAADFNLGLLGIHLMGKVGQLSIHSEYAKSVSENPAPIISGRADGYFVQLSYLINDSIRPSIRYGTLDYLDMGNLFGRKPTDYDTRVTALAINYYLTKAIVFKLEYDLISEGLRKIDKDNNILALQAAVRF